MNISKHKNFLLLLLAISVQNLVAIIQTISVTWYILNKFGEAKSGLYLALYFSCYLVPQILIGPLFGALVDRYNRKNIIITAAFSRCILLLLLALFFFQNVFPVVFLFIIIIVNSAMSTFSTTAVNATIPNIVKDEHLLNANSAICLNENLGFMVGAAVAGFLYFAIGMAGVFLTNGILYALIGSSLLFLHIPKLITKTTQLPKQEKNTQVSTMTLKKVFLSLKEGFISIKKDKPIFLIILIGLILNLFLFPFDSILLPKIIKYTLQLGAYKFGFMQSINYMGAIFGLLVLTLIPKRSKSVYSILLLSLFVYALNFILIGILVLPVSLKAIGVNGIYILLCTLGFVRFSFDSLSLIPIKTIYQKRIQNHLRGRFYGFTNTLSVGLQPVGSGIIGTITSLNYFSSASIIITLGLLILVVASIAVTSSEIKKLYLQINFSTKL